MANIFQTEITPIKPNGLSQERIFVYVPEATNERKGIASFEENQFIVNNGHVELDVGYLSDTPFDRPSLIQLDENDFLFTEDKITQVNWPYAYDASGSSRTNGYGLIKIAGASAGYLKYNSSHLLEVDETKLLNTIHNITDPIATNVANLQDDLAAEVLARGAADTALGGRIDDEIAARIGGDSALGVRIDNEVLARGAADTALGSRIDNEILARGAADTALSNRITTIEGLIPDDATTSNKLISYNSVADMINSVTAYYITKNAQGDPFATYSELENATIFYSGGEVRVPTRNDYCYVLSDENHDNATTRYSYQNGQWEYQITVNETALTTEQLAAINSGITADLVAKINTAVQKEVINNLYKTIINSNGSIVTIQKALVNAPSGTASESNIIGIDANAKAYMSSSEAHGVTANPQYTSSKIYTDGGIIKYEVTNHNVLDVDTMTYSDVVTDGEIATLNDLSNFVDLSVIAEEYNVGEIYNIGDYVIYNNELYVATANNISGTWDNTKWNNVTIGDALELIESKIYNLLQGSAIITLSASGWDNQTKTQTINFAHDTSKRNVIDVEPASVPDYANNGVYASSDTSTTITFTCDIIPTTNLYFRVVSEEVTYASV